MFQIGESLREARTRRGFTPADVHKAIRIRERYLTALEEERWDMLPGEAYTKGFLRTYSDYLGLNGQLYVDEYNARVARHEDDAPPLVPQPAGEGGRASGRRILLAVAAVVVVGAAVAGLVAWQLGGSSNAPHPSSSAGSGHGSVASSTSPATTSTPKTTTPNVAAAKPVFTSITATRGRCWLLVRAGGPQGTVVYQGTLDQGEVKTFHFTTRLWLRMGDPTNVDITLAGKPVTGLPASPSNVILTRAGALRQ
jgi:cytoskeletal protein RodZ